MANKTVPFVVKEATERKVFAPVLIPNEPDSDNDIVSADKIRQVHDLFNEKYRNIDVQHSLQNVGKVYESYILPQDTTYNFGGNEYMYPMGTWMMGVKVTDDEAWELVKQGVLTGFSIMAVNPALKGNAQKSEDGRTTLADLGDEWIVNAVSLVTEPAVPRAKFISVKSASEEQSLWTKFLKAIKFGLKSVEETDTNTKVDIEEVSDLTKDEILALMQEMMAPLVEQINALTPQKEVPAEEVEKTIDEETQLDEVVSEVIETEVVESESVEKEESTETETIEEVEVEKVEEEAKPTVEELMAKIAELEKQVAQKGSKVITGQHGLNVVKSQEITIKSKYTRDEFGRRV